jgi:hypothetical protein
MHHPYNPIDRLPFSLHPNGFRAGPALHKRILTAGRKNVKRLGYRWLTGLSTIYFMLISFYMILGTEHRLAEFLDQQHESSGAPASDLQQIRDRSIATTFSILGFSGLALLIPMIYFIVYRYWEEPKFYRAYRQFCQHARLGEVTGQEAQLISHELNAHCLYLHTHSGFISASALAWLLSDILENFIYAIKSTSSISKNQPGTLYSTPFVDRLNASLAAHHAAIQLLPAHIDSSQLRIHIHHDQQTTVVNREWSSQDVLHTVADHLHDLLINGNYADQASYGAKFLSCLLDDASFTNNTNTATPVLARLLGFGRYSLEQLPIKIHRIYQAMSLPHQDRYIHLLLDHDQVSLNEFARFLHRQNPSPKAYRFLLSQALTRSADHVRHLLQSKDYHQPDPQVDGALIERLLAS